MRNARFTNRAARRRRTIAVVAAAAAAALAAAGPFAMAATADELPTGAEAGGIVAEQGIAEQGDPGQTEGGQTGTESVEGEPAEPAAEDAEAEVPADAETGDAAEAGAETEGEGEGDAAGKPGEPDPASFAAPVAGGPAADAPQGVVNVAPVVSDESVDAIAGEYVNLAAPGVLANDIDADGDELELLTVNVPAHGVLYNWSSDGSVGYVPNAGFTGTDTIEYLVSDGQHQVWAEVIYHVTEPDNYGPRAWSEQAVVYQDQSLHLGAPGVLSNDSDLDGDALTVVSVQGPNHGTGTITADGTVDYTPAAGYVGPDWIYYTISDGTETAATFLDIDVLATGAPSPLMVLGDHYTAVSGATLDVPAPGLLGNDQAFNPGGIFVDGVEGVNGTILWHADGSFRYTPSAGFTGVDTFEYSVTDIDGHAHAGAIVSITVLAAPEDCEPEGDDEPTPPSLVAPSAVAAAVPAPAPEPDCEPGEPTDPEEPTDSGEPTTPTEPEQPAPEQPAQPTTAVATTETAALAQTGLDLGPLLGIPLLAIVIGASIVVARRRKDVG